MSIRREAEVQGVRMSQRLKKSDAVRSFWRFSQTALGFGVPVVKICFGLSGDFCMSLIESSQVGWG